MLEALLVWFPKLILEYLTPFIHSVGLRDTQTLLIEVSI